MPFYDFPVPVFVVFATLKQPCMRYLYTLVFTFFTTVGFAQHFSLNDLVSFTGYTPSRFENSISKKGFRSAGFSTNDAPTYSWHATKKAEVEERSIFKSDKEDPQLLGSRPRRRMNLTGCAPS